MHTFLHHGLSFLGDGLNARLMTGDLSLQRLVLLQQVLDTNQIFAWGKHQERLIFRTSVSNLTYLRGEASTETEASSKFTAYLFKLSI